ncbi:hypothetical protein Scep_023358 [Stephania cephalantha]|uniref:Uncharacterized protein n=1 Tax=Stephania cephalantha TaxID=152367 RepID=A0AAP0HSQ2_9MAGN
MLPVFPSTHHRLLRRLFSSSTSSRCPTTQPPLDHPIYMIWGSNTAVGKTLVSAGLADSVLSGSSSPAIDRPIRFNYIKPVQTGFPLDSDSRFVYRKVSDLFAARNPKPNFSLFASNRAIRGSRSVGLGELGVSEEKVVVGEGGVVERELRCETVFSWREAVSPHLAVEREGAAVGDAELVESLRRCLRVGDGGGGDWTVIETAGGVASPGPSGTLQCDLYRPYRLPAILVGDGRLGGISGTISAYECLTLRGYDVVAVILEDRGLANEVPLMSYLRKRVPVLVLPSVPEDPSNDLIKWFNEAHGVFCSLKETILSAYSERMERLHEMPQKAGNILWWPFTQHSLVPEENVTVIDSRCGENFAVYKGGNHGFVQQFDACASWWTQGPNATLQVELARDMGYTAARFGHVMFPENVYEPALKCAELLLQGVGQGWASRAYFSDNGSTAVEIALKMAFRKFTLDHGILLNSQKGSMFGRPNEFKVLALNGSYHGDTLGAMEAQAPSSYTGFLQQPWYGSVLYTGRGLFLDPPTVFICDGHWTISLSNVLQPEVLRSEDTTFTSSDEIFCRSRDHSDLARHYSAYIVQKLSSFSQLGSSTRIGALIIEPGKTALIQAAGGMHMIDPLFQRVLVKECQSRKIPVIFDEVFTGFWRLGSESAAEILGCLPDIACFGKLMTGGVIPLAATLATDAVYNAFKGDSKLVALLHGHSYSAHAMGCAAAATAIQWFKDPSTNHNISVDQRRLKELWDSELVQKISSHSAVKRVVLLGTLFAVELRAEGSDVGYSSMYASSLIQKLRADGIYTRPLGNVIYLMCGPCTPPHICNQLLKKLYGQLHEFSQSRWAEVRSVV